MTWLLRLQGKVELAKIVAAAGPRSADANWQLSHRAQGYIREFLTRLHEGRFDAIICPPHALPALPHGQGQADVIPAASHTLVMNLLGVPCGVVATGYVQPGEESDRPASRSPLVHRCRMTERGSAGLPVGVQVAARHWREDIVLAVMGLH